jgi:Cupredoxin-like domain
MHVHAMRKLFFVIAVLAIVGVAPAFAQAASITITKTGFSPASVTIAPGESITWTNSDTVDHQVSSSKASLASPVLHAGQTFSFKFATAGKFAITDLLVKKLKSGMVSVQTAGPAGQTVSLLASSSRTTFKGAVTLSGVVSNNAANQTVTISGQSYGQNAFVKLADVTTTAGGAWTYTARPTIRTVYQSTWAKHVSTQLTVGVRPLVNIRALAGNRFSTKVLAAHSFAGKFVQMQRRSATGQWLTLKRVRLNSMSAATIKASLPMGTSTLRFAFSVNQAGAGYLAGFSRTLVYHRG